MDYSTVVESYAKLEATHGRLEMTETLVKLLKSTPPKELAILVYLTQGKLRPEFEGVETGIAEKLALRAITTAAGTTEKSARDAYVELGDIGNAAEKLLLSTRQQTLASSRLTLEEVYETLLAIAKMSGQGTIESKLGRLVRTLNEATPLEAKYIVRAATGVLRLGVADYTVLDACAIAFLGGKEHRAAIERAYNVTSDLGYVAELAAEGGLKGVEAVRVKVGNPIRPMLAERLESAAAVMKKMGKAAAAEYKLDGERVQVHKKGEKVELYSRRLEDITAIYPDVIDLARKFVKARDAILEGEVVAINEETGEYLPFQELMHRRRKHGVEKAMEEYPTAINFFDLLFLDGKDYTRRPYTERRKKLEELLAANDRMKPVPRIVTSDPEKVEQFMEQAIADGCEGLVVKDPESEYRAGSREFSWIKLKREYRSELTDTIDLVVVGAYHGKGRRAGRYGTYLLAAYDDKAGRYPTITKIGTGFSDDDLKRFPKLLKEYESTPRPPDVESEQKPDIWFKPKIVIETIASEVTLSPIYPAGIGSIRKNVGLALRFPKFTGKVRDDKSPEDATTVKEIIEMYRLQKRQPVDRSTT